MRPWACEDGATRGVLLRCAAHVAKHPAAARVETLSNGSDGSTNVRVTGPLSSVIVSNCISSMIVPCDRAGVFHTKVARCACGGESSRCPIVGLYLITFIYPGRDRLWSPSTRAHVCPALAPNGTCPHVSEGRASECWVPGEETKFGAISTVPGWSDINFVATMLESPAASGRVPTWSRRSPGH